MKLVGMHCGKEFEWNNEKFCHNSCRDAHIISLENKVRESVKNDPSHTTKMSNEWKSILIMLD